MNLKIKNHQVSYLSIALLIYLQSCIGEDIIFDLVKERVKITSAVETLKLGEMHQLEAMYFNQIGIEENASINWVSSSPNIISIDNSGFLSGLSTGTVHIIASLESDPTIADSIMVEVSNETTMLSERTGSLTTTSSYILQGDFTLKVTGDGSLVLELADNFKASSTLPGLYVYLTNNPNTNNGALELSLITKFVGSSTFNIPVGTDINQYSHVLFYCKPFVVKVGDGVFDN